MEWYYSQNGAQHGPVSEAELQAMVAAGSVLQTDLAWHEAMTDWTAVSQVRALHSNLQATAPPHSPPHSPPQLSSAPQAQPYQTPSVQQPQAQAMVSGLQGSNIPTYLWQSIVVTLLCCLPGGIVAIIYAARVDGLKQAGDYGAAGAASNSAKTWCWVSFGVGLVFTLLYLFAVIAAEM